MAVVLVLLATPAWSKTPPKKPITLKKVITTVKQSSPSANADQKNPLSLKKILEAVDAPVSNKVSVPEKVSTENRLFEMVVTGNKTIPTTLILNQIMLRPGDGLSPALINRNIQLIQSLGVFQSVRTAVDNTPKGRRLTFFIQENSTISAIQFTGNTVFSGWELEALLKSKANDVLNLRLVRADIDILQDFYHQKGYSMAKVVSVETPDASGQPLIYKISEGVIEDITVTGNFKTKSHVILREMVTQPGEPFQEKTLKEDLRRVYNLNYFTDLQPNFLPGKEANTSVMEINVTERESSGTFTFGGGFSQYSGFNIFSDLYWDNLFGEGQVIMLKGQFNLGGTSTSGQSTTYQFKYVNPWMWDKRKSLTLKTWATDGQVPVTPLSGGFTNRNERRKGVEIDFGIPFSYELKTNTGFKYETVTLPDVKKSYKVHSLLSGISYDTRDVWFNPTEGEFHSLNVEKSFKLTEDSLDFTRIDLSLRKFFKVVDQQVLALRYDVGFMTAPNITDQDLFSGEYYRIGGADTVRGFADWPPRYSGNAKMLASVEYRFLFTDSFQFILFMDTGFATLQGYSKFLQPANFIVGKGVGVRFNIPPLGAIRLDFGLDDLGVSRLHFSIGQAF